MLPAALILFLCSLLLISGCSSQSNSQTTSAPSPAGTSPANPAGASVNATPSPVAAVVKPTIDACTVLTSDEIKAVQGEAVKETKPSNQTEGKFIASQCYYALPTLSNSVSVTLTERNPNVTSESMKDLWEARFGKEENKSERERKKEREEKKQEARREGEEEEGAPLEPVRGVGEEAFWSASRVGGALYVLKGDRYLRISVGGAGDIAAKLKKSKTLALKALKRM